MDLLPSALPKLPKSAKVAWDTETSGLFADDGARVSTASVAWIDKPTRWAKYDNVTTGYEEISPGYEAPIVSVAWPFDQGNNGKPEDNGQGTLFGDDDNLSLDEWVALCGWLSKRRLTAQNIKFDLEKMRVGVRRWPGVGVELIDNIDWDTQNVNHLLWPLFVDPKTSKPSTSLKPVCAWKFGQEWADEGELVRAYLRKHKLPVGRWDLIPWNVIGSYANTDARITLMLRLRQEWEIVHEDAGSWLWNKTVDIMAEGQEKPIRVVKAFDPDAVHEKIQRRLTLARIAYKIERAGIPYDQVGSIQAADECVKRAGEVAGRLPFTPATGPEAKRFFFTEGTSRRGIEHLNMVPYATSEKTGEPSLTAEIAARMVEDQIPYADLWADYSKATTAESMWYRGYADKVGSDGRLRCSIRLNGTISSRWSVERLNLQAIPQDYRLSDHRILDGIATPRDLIAAAVDRMDGWRLFELDLAQAELRVATVFAKCKLMWEMIEAGEDLHTFTTKALFPDEDPAGPLFMSKFRQVGKRGNFSLCFGSGGPTFRAMVRKETGIELGDIESVRIVNEWNRLYPEFRQAIDYHSNRVVRRQTRFGNAWVDLRNGERRWFTKYEEAHKAFNQRVQANLAQFGMDWMIQVDNYLEEAGVDEQAMGEGIGHAGLIMQVHDALILLLPDDELGQSLADDCAQIGRDLWSEVFPEIPGDVDYHSWTHNSPTRVTSYSPVGQMKDGKVAK